MTLEATLNIIVKQAKIAALKLSMIDSATKEKSLKKAAEKIIDSEKEIISAN